MCALAIVKADRATTGRADPFNALGRHWDAAHGLNVVRVLPGQFYVTSREDEMITTVLGSCIAACIRDVELNIGGLNHFMLPKGDLYGGSDTSRYGAFAMEHLINEILKRGGRRERMEVKIFGGGKIMRGMTDIGRKNIDFVRHFLKTEELPIVSEDVGLAFSRKIHYFPLVGKVMVKRLPSLHSAAIEQEEVMYSKKLGSEAASGTVELFD